MTKNERFFTKFITSIAVFGSLFLICDFANAASRASARPAPTSRKTVTTTNTPTVTSVESEKETANTTTKEVIDESETIMESEEVAPLIISNKSAQFENIISDIMDSATPDNSFAEQIRRQRNALAASEASIATKTSQQKSLSTNSHSCDTALRKCMSETCGADFTKCALDGDTAFGDKLNKCRKNTNCTAEEFSLFGTEIKSDRDMNVRLASYNNVIDCGNDYNACIVNECGTTYGKCLGQKNANAAIQKCSIIAKECSGADSGLAARFGNAIGKLRENAEKDIKSDESRLYALRDLMSNQCKSLGATFDERSFDCVYSIEFYAGENQSAPLASRKAYAGDSFICMQEWFGVNATTYRENAYRETRAQTAASSAMLGSGVGTAAGLISSGAINRAIDTQKAQKALKEECTAQGGTFKNGKCSVDYDGVNVPSNPKPTTPKPVTNNNTPPNNTLNNNNNNDDENDLNQQNVSKNGISATAKNYFYIKYMGNTQTTVQTECQFSKNDSNGWLKDTSLQKCNDLNINNWRVDFDYGSIFGEARCAINTINLYNTGTPNDQEGQGCWCHGVEYISTKGIKSTYISKLPWLYVAKLGNTPKECEMMCTRYCANEVLKIPHVRKTIFGIK